MRLFKPFAALFRRCGRTQNLRGEIVPADEHNVDYVSARRAAHPPKKHDKGGTNNGQTKTQKEQTLPVGPHGPRHARQLVASRRVCSR